MSTEAQLDIDQYGFNPDDMPDCFLPDNFDEIFQRIGIHGTRHSVLVSQFTLAYNIQPTINSRLYVLVVCCVFSLRGTLPSSC